MEMYNEKKSKGFEVVSVNVKDSAPEVLDFLQQYGATFIGALNRTRADVMKLYGVTGMPTNIVIDRNGNILEKVVGYNMAKLDRAISKAGI